MGNERVLGHFKKLTTKNEKNIVQFIHGNYEEISAAEIARVLKHFISHLGKSEATVFIEPG